MLKKGEQQGHWGPRQELPSLSARHLQTLWSKRNGEGDDWAVMRKGSRTSLKTVLSWTGCSSTSVVLAWVRVCLQRDTTDISRQATPSCRLGRVRDYTQRLGIFADSGHTVAS